MSSRITAATLLGISLWNSGCAHESESTRPRVVLLGFDGASWDTIEPSLTNGSLPYLKELRERSAWARLQTFKPTKSPVIWTSIATGKSMEKHGILDFVYLEENDLQVPYSNSQRREPSLWQILDKFGMRSGVVNWFVTYPPDWIEGTVVSNRFRRALLLNERRRDAMSDTVHPAEKFEELRKLMDTDFVRVKKATGLPDLAERFRTLHPERELSEVAVLKDFPSFVLQDALIENVSEHLYASEDFDLFATYFRLPDIVQHVALHLITSSPEDPARAREEIALLLEPFYRYLERIVEHYVTTSPENTIVIVVSDHGFALHPGGYDHYHIPAEMPPPDGIFLMHGPSVVPGSLPSVTVYDIAPTVLHLFGLPVGSEMDGRPLGEALDGNREIEYERYTDELMRTTENQQDDEIDQKTLEELRSLGYIK